MGVRFPGNGSNVVVAATVITTTETVVVQTPLITISQDNAPIFLTWYVAFTAPAGPSAVNLKLRRGATTSGTLLTNGIAGFTTIAGNGYILSGCWTDVPGAVGPLQYSICYLASAASGNTSILDCSMFALCL